ncbi:MAG: endonuclease MutS2 [candidate division Zixibacteria bacterium]|nr:endonuclease MutS2 [candidate division Zixibacteria bacterium]
MLPAVVLIAGFIMHEIDAHSIEILEFPRVIEIIGGMSLSPYGKDKCHSISPLFDKEKIERSLRQSSQMREIIRFEEAMPLTRIEDISEVVEKSKIDGIHLDPKSLLSIKLFLDTIIDLSKYGKAEDRQEKFPDVCEIIKKFHPKYEITKAINKAIDSAGEILNSASSKLGHIRRDLGDTESRLKQHLTKILASRKKHAGWQDDVITIRDGRFVVPVLSNEFKQEGGIVHDKSHSGATLYVEPNSAIPINNKLRQLQQDEKLEIARILMELTALVGEAASDIELDLNTYGELDSVHAKATFALKIDAHSPIIEDNIQLELIDARHPLLLYGMDNKESVIPLTVKLDRANQGILITGPNTGGKTVALKAIGLLALMALSGLEIPADHKSKIGMYQKIYADIGDEQSIELSLSTFSSHIRNIIAAVNDADHNSLILFDEIGAGTDPKEGAALAEIVLLYLLDMGCNLIATTHYSQLKTLPLDNPGLLNASLEFDRVNLQPTFRLKLGIPGASYAIDIARRLGLPDHLADEAANLIGSGERSLDKLIAKLDLDLDHLHQEKRKLEDSLQKSKSLEAYYLARKEQLDKKEDEISGKHIDELERQVIEGRKEIDRLVKQIRESSADPRKVKEVHHSLKELGQAIQKKKKVQRNQTATNLKDLKKGETVWIEKFRTEGEVVEMHGNKRVKVAVGKAFMTVDTIDVTRRDTKGSKSKPDHKHRITGVQADAAQGDFQPEIMLRGMTVEEALEALDKFLDDAILAGLGQVYIVHGKGTGALRKNLSTYLKAHKSVASIRIGDWNEGGHGVTIARLKT